MSLCLQVQDGKIVWQVSLTRDFGGGVPRGDSTNPRWLTATKSSCTPGGPDATLVALDKLTGKTVWKSQVPDKLPERLVDASAIAIDFEGQRQYVQLTAQDARRGRGLRRQVPLAV